MDNKKPRIAIFQSDLNVGGIQKSLINLLNNIDTTQYRIDLYLFSTINFFKDDLPDTINIYYLKGSFFLTKFIYFKLFKLFKRIHKNKKHYDLSIDFNSYQHCTAFGAISVKADKKVMWIHNDIEKKLKYEKRYKILHHFFKSKYSYFDTFVGVSDGVIDSFKKVHKLKNKNYTIIPNYIDTKEIIEKSNEPIDIDIDVNKYNLVSVGRLCYQKGFDILIKDMVNIVDKRKDLCLYIIGDGPEKDRLQKQISSNNLSSYITLLGSQQNPYSYLKHMDGFVLTSRYEGQGMVLLEAKCLGLELIFSKHLEKYNSNLIGSEDIIQSIISLQKKQKEQDLLIEYNQNIKTQITKLFNRRNIEKTDIICLFYYNSITFSQGNSSFPKCP